DNNTPAALVVSDARVILIENGQKDTLIFNDHSDFYESERVVKVGHIYSLIVQKSGFSDATTGDVICPDTASVSSPMVTILSDKPYLICSYKPMKTEVVLCSGTFYIPNYQKNLFFRIDGENTYSPPFNCFNELEILKDGQPLYDADFIFETNSLYTFNIKATRELNAKYGARLIRYSREFVEYYKTSDDKSSIKTGLVAAGAKYSNIQGGYGLVFASSVTNIVF
ncbi:MAG: DUF4249 family protein, partial [Saprospiraceae bacterium]